MALSSHPDVQTPPDDATLWRYMDMPKFFALLEQRALYFALPSELEDKWEFVLGRDLTRNIASMTSPSASGSLLELQMHFLSHVAINCWFCGDDESIAMWHLYTQPRYGVAIRTNAGRLKHALRNAKREVFLGQVTYKNHTDVPLDGVPRSRTSFPAVFQKRICYKHESEVRAVTPLYPDPPDDSREEQFHVSPAAPIRGENVPIDLEDFIIAVVTGPGFPIWALELLERALQRAGVSIPILASQAFDAPMTRYFE